MVGASATEDTIKQPILFEPGTDWKYSIGLDWAGVLLTRVSGQSLEEYFKSNIFDKCGMTSTSFFPTQDLKSRMMKVCERNSDGSLRPEAAPTMGREMDAGKVGPFLSGGGGLFGTAKDYLSFLRAILASSPQSAQPASNPLLSASSYRELFTHALDANSSASLSSLAAMAKDQNIHDPAVLTNGTGDHIAHSVGLFINKIDSKFGRKANSGCWDGAAKTYYFIDPASGIAVSQKSYSID
jgi:methyl acetate hydrolase